MTTRAVGIDRSGPALKTTGQASFALLSVDADGIKTSFDAPIEDTEYSGVDLNGAEITDGALEGSNARNVTVTLSSTTGGFNAGSIITVAGVHPYYDDKVQTEVLTITQANGNQTLTTSKLFRAGQPLSILIEAQPDLDPDPQGTFLIGVGVAREITPPANWLYFNATGNFYMRLRDDPDGAIVKAVIPVEGAYPFSAEAIHASTSAGIAADMWAVAEE